MVSLEHGNTSPEVIKYFSCTTQLSMRFVLSINLKLLTIANSFLLNIAELLAFSYLFARKISCSAELNMKKVL